jgi:hypothetical protein
MSRQYYNGTQNDQWIVECVFPGKRDGYFFEAGAANGIAGSSCYILEKELNWTGICIEPNEMFYRKLVKNRPNSKCEQACLHHSSGEVEYIEGVGNSQSPFLGGVKSSLEKILDNPEVGHKVLDRTMKVIDEGKIVRRKSVTIEELLDKYNAPEIIDYGAFDIEGNELNALSTFPFDKYRFLAMSLELDEKNHRLVGKLLAPHGYKEVKNPFNQDKPWEKYYLHESLS